ncbi:hypothetical protein DZA50_06885 [Kangiella sp. HD9-110m-PIT-SAG07]|nr:hypothetical protein DZA50_06885 [Kangiella sp. HD9-110m-PIT-SAG07]
MKIAFKIALTIMLIIASNSYAGELTSDKSKLLLENIRTDISRTLSSVADIESSKDWTVYLSQSNGRLVRMGVVIEPSTQTVLSVSADGTAHAMALRPGDIIKSVKLNGKDYGSQISSAQLTHGDELEVSIQRKGELLELNQLVESSFIPSWQLYSSSADNLGTTLKSANTKELSMNLQSSKSIALLKKLEARINFTLSEIYKLESVKENSFTLDFSKVARVNTELGLSIGENNQVLSIKSGSNAEQLGLRVGDFIKGFKLGKGDSFKQELSSLKLQPNEKFSLQVIRKDKKIILTGTANPTINPSWSMKVKSELHYPDEECGIITTLANPPASSWKFFKAHISEVNGNRVKSSGLAYKLPAGINRIKVHERVPSSETRFSLTEKKRFSFSDAKIIEFLVVPNKRYFLGSKLIKSKRFKTRTGEYWEPYVWKVEDYECSMEG